MREILFRGKRIANGEWYYGSYLFLHKSPVDWTGAERGKPEDVHYIINDQDINYAVDPSTVGQYTGLTDKNGKRIFEGDVIKSWQGRILAVKFGQYRDDEEVVSGNGWYVSGEYATLSFDERWGGHEVIGNIHDNPELLKEANP